MSDEAIHVRLTQVKDYQFNIEFGGSAPPVLGDESAPLGAGLGPTPVQLLAAAVGNCLSDSLLFALRKFKQAPEPIRCDIYPEVGRNAQGRLRVLSMRAVLSLGVPAASLANLPRVLDTFEAYCTVTQSVGQGIAMQVEVVDVHGERLK